MSCKTSWGAAIQVLGKATSINVRKVLWVCHELAVPYELQEWGSGHQSTETADLRALNPNAMVPVIRDGAFVALVRKSPAHADQAAISAGVRDWNRHMTMLEGRLQKTGTFAAGARFTLADIVLGLSTNRWFLTPMERPALPAVAAYYERLNERAGFRMHGRNGVP